MKGPNSHKWAERDDVVAFCFAMYGSSPLGRDLNEVSSFLGIETGAMKMRISNYHWLMNGKGLSNVCNQERKVFVEYKYANLEACKDMLSEILGE